MKTLLSTGASLLALSLLTTPAIAQVSTSNNNPVLRDVVIVTATRESSKTTESISPDHQPVQGVDATQIIARTPGAARIGNGPVSGQMQYRGLFGERMNLRIDNQRFASGGPNLMDPVLHYAPVPLIETIEIDRGASPVSEGPGLAGGANAVFKRVDYASGDAFLPAYDLTASSRTVDDSYSIGGIGGGSTDALRFNVLAAYEEGGDTDFPGGVVGGSGFDRSVYGASIGGRFANQEVTLDLRRQNTGYSGNPPFPMDIRFFDTDFARAAWSADVSGVEISVAASYSDVSHGMNNFEQRPAPPPMMQRETLADATTRGLEASATFAAGPGMLQLGADYDDVDRNVLITNPNNPAFFLNNLPDIETQRTGVFAEWVGDLGAFNGEFGLRVDDHDDSAGMATVGTAVPAMPRMLAMSFNNSDRTASETTVDALARLWMETSENLTLRMTIGQKQRAPGYLERFGWLPTNASGGLADGNIYVGDLNLDPESMLITEVGFDYSDATYYLRPTLFYRHIDDYIQGVPFDDTVGVIDSLQEMVANMNGDPTPLRFGNVDARLYGVDLAAGMRLAQDWRIDAVASYVRGERRDIDDNLYRVAPPNLTAGLTYDQPSWSATLEARAVAEQTKVSATNSERETPGYVVLSLFGEWQVHDGVAVSAGVENLLDHRYRDHLSGYNRNGFGDVPIGERIPGAGRGAFLRVHITG